MDALTLLIADHNRVRGMFARFQEANDAGDDATMTAVASEICTDLEVHTTIEEEIFYPAVHDLSTEIGETVDEGEQEHHVAKMLMTELGQVEPASDEWIAKMTVLIESVEHHAEEEETSLFPPVRSNSDKDLLEELATRMEARKAELGAPVLEDKIGMTKAELSELAKEQQIPGRSTMSQEELAATVAPS